MTFFSERVQLSPQAFAFISPLQRSRGCYSRPRARAGERRSRSL
jgi:hypothetical protein